jgi:hypothetical protein
MFTAAMLDTGWCIEKEGDCVSGLILPPQRLQMRVCLRPQRRKEIIVTDEMLLCCRLLQPARKEREVTIDRGLAMLLCKEREISRESEMRKFRWQRTRDTSKEFVTVEVRTPIAPHMQFVQTERQKEASDDLTQTLECEGGVVGEARGDEIDVMITEGMSVRISVLQEKSQHRTMCLMIEEPTGLLWSDIEFDVLFIIECDYDFAILYFRLLSLVLSM